MFEMIHGSNGVQMTMINRMTKAPLLHGWLRTLLNGNPQRGLILHNSTSPVARVYLQLQPPLQAAEENGTQAKEIPTAQEIPIHLPRLRLDF